MTSAQRAWLLSFGAVSMMLPFGSAVAQDSTTTLDTLRECAAIDDPTARLACFDNNVQSNGVQPSESDQRTPRQTNTPQGFGAESMRTPQRFVEREDHEIHARVTAIRERQPGIYLVTLEDGAQWVFEQGAGRYYRPPRKGSTVQIERGALGGFLLRFDKQAPIGVRRIQ